MMLRLQGPELGHLGRPNEIYPMHPVLPSGQGHCGVNELAVVVQGDANLNGTYCSVSLSNPGGKNQGLSIWIVQSKPRSERSDNSIRQTPQL
jgi:hypothetical protein